MSVRAWMGRSPQLGHPQSYGFLEGARRGWGNVVDDPGRGEGRGEDHAAGARDRGILLRFQESQ